MEVRFKAAKCLGSGSGSRPAPLIGRTDGTAEQRDFTSCDSTPATPAVTSTLTSRLAFRPLHCCSFIVKYGPRITGSLAWKPHRKATCMHTPKPQETSKEMGWDAKCVRVCLPARAMHIYLMHPLNLALAGRQFAEHLAFMGMGVLRGRFRAKLPSFHRQSSHSGNIPPFNFRVPPLCTSSSELNSRWKLSFGKKRSEESRRKTTSFFGKLGGGGGLEETGEWEI